MRGLFFIAHCNSQLHVLCSLFCTLRFARLQPAIKAVFHQLFGQQTSWDPAVLTRWKEIMVGSHDDSIRAFSEKLPEQCDTQATLLENRAKT